MPVAIINEAGVVVQVQPEPDHTGRRFVECPAYVCPGFFYDGSTYWPPVPQAPEPVLLSAREFSARFTESERDFICEHMAKLALAVVTAPNGVDVTDAKAQEARAALEAAGWSAQRLDEIFAAPE